LKYCVAFVSSNRSAIEQSTLQRVIEALDGFLSGDRPAHPLLNLVFSAKWVKPTPS
jgi:hypothetical protein